MVDDVSFLKNLFLVFWQSLKNVFVEILFSLLCCQHPYILNEALKLKIQIIKKLCWVDVYYVRYPTKIYTD